MHRREGSEVDDKNEEPGRGTAFFVRSADQLRQVPRDDAHRHLVEEVQHTDPSKGWAPIHDVDPAQDRRLFVYMLSNVSSLAQLSGLNGNRKYSQTA